MKNVPPLLLIAIMALLSCSKDESLPQYTTEPIYIRTFEYIFTSEDEWTYTPTPSGEPGYHSNRRIVYLSFPEVDTNQIGGVFVNGELVHSHKDGAYAGSENLQRGDLVEIDRYSIAKYVNGECLYDGERQYHSEVVAHVDITNAPKLDNPDESLFSPINIDIRLKRKPQPEETFLIRFEMWNFRWGYYAE